jgi:hypothetical protein
VALAKKRKSKKHGSSRKDLRKFRQFLCNHFGHLASQCSERKKKKEEEEEEGLVIVAKKIVTDFVDKFDREYSLFTLVSSAKSTGIVSDNRWIIDNGASCYMTRIWCIFLSIIEIGTGQLVQSEGRMEQAIRGVGRVRFHHSNSILENS